MESREMVNNSKIEATVIVCTYNRGESLRETLASLKKQKTAPGRRWEVIVVDNNSKDHTCQVVKDAQHDWPNLRYEFESEQGLSYARNHGIQCAYGDVILFTDDDVLPEPEWLENTLNGLTAYQADACGGFIGPIWETPPPSWLTDRFYGFLAVRNECDKDYWIERASQAPFGANMAFRKAVFNKVGLFNTTRGRKGKVLASGEDIEMFERVLDYGMKVVFLGQSRVHHKIETFRITKRYFRKWQFQTSRNLAISKGVQGHRRILNIPLYLFPRFLNSVIDVLIGQVTLSKDESFKKELAFFHYIGTFQGLWQARNQSITNAIQ